MREANALQGKFEGWTHERVDAVMRDLFNTCLSPAGWDEFRGRFFGAACTVNLEDYARARAEFPRLERKEPEAICVDHVVTIALMTLPEDLRKPFGKAGTVELTFGWGEQFRHKINRMWISRAGIGPAVLDLVSHVGDGDMRRLVGLQAADLLAWHTNRYRREGFLGAPESGAFRVFATPNHETYFDYETLKESFAVDCPGFDGGSIPLGGWSPCRTATDQHSVYTINYRILYVFFFISHDRRELIHFNVTANPTAAWIWQQLLEATPWGRQAAYLIHDRDAVYGRDFDARAGHLGIAGVRTPPRAPKANSIAERLVETIRTECLDHIIVVNEGHRRRVLTEFMHYYNHDRPQRTLSLQSPVPRANPGQGPCDLDAIARRPAPCIRACGLNSDGSLPPHR